MTSQFLGVGRFFGNLLLDGGELSGGDDCCGVTAALDLALIGHWKGVLMVMTPWGPGIFSLRYV